MFNHITFILGKCSAVSFHVQELPFFNSHMLNFMLKNFFQGKLLLVRTCWNKMDSDVSLYLKTFIFSFDSLELLLFKWMRQLLWK